MQESVLGSICSRLTKGQLVQVKTLVGRTLQGQFLSYENTGVTSLLMILTSGSTLCLTCDQIERVLLIEDENVEDTLSPEIID
jgi:hypothetical protein